MLALGSTEILFIFILLALIIAVPLGIIIYLNIKNKRKQFLPESETASYLSESKLENLNYLRERNLINAAEYERRRAKIMNEV